MAEEDPTTIADEGRLSPRSSHSAEAGFGENQVGDLDSTTPGSKPSGPESSKFDFRPGSTIGRYEIRKKIGKGGFGEVYLAHDETLRRTVALKVITRGNLDESEEGLLEEGRTMAQLDHPGIVAVHDVGYEDGCLYFVSKFIEGETLGHYMRGRKLSPEEVADLIADLAEALNYAHTRSVIHRDIKPNNIIITPESQPVLIDFGIALGIQPQKIGHRWAIMGTPSYMSPEQARGESHLVDGRSDIYSLGVILYEMLTGLRPFEARTEDLLDQVASPTLEARPPRQIDARIPKAIERICLKALAKRTADRYSTAQDLADDLKAFVASWETKKSTETRSFHAGPVIPKGLRAFDESDANFFLRLLPGMRDQAGIPDGIRFWQRGITNRINPFRVGVLYGPSGSGKSSFLKAGLIPLLPDEIEVLYVAAEAERTETALLERLQAQFPPLAEEKTLTDAIRRVREEKLLPSTGKLLIVIDQFEQWLHASGGAPDSDLVAALRQCDGRTVQILVTLRDDFWMAIGQLMEEIDVDLLLSQNAAAIDLFEKPHAWRVLIEFGRAYEKLPPDESTLSAEQSEFIRAALNDMASDGKIIPLQLALFAEMAKGVDWTLESYEKLGGATAIGVEFLNSVFTSRQANPAHRAIETEGRAILEALLPAGGERIRGRALMKAELIEKTRLEIDEKRFATTMAILDGELRLVTPADASRTEIASEANEETKRYQLTHDYLIPPLREWLYQKKQASARGRAQIRLSEMASQYEAKPDRRHLPSFLDWMRFRLLTRRASWTEPQQSMMKEGSRILAIRGFVIIAALISLLGVTHILTQQAARVQSFEQYVEAPSFNASNLLERLEPYRENFRELASQKIGSISPQSSEWLNLAVFLLPDDPSLKDSIFRRGMQGSLDEYQFAIRELRKQGGVSTDELWESLSDPLLSRSQSIRLAGALAAFAPEDPQWGQWNANVARWLTDMNQSEAEIWSGIFEPVKSGLEEPLLETFGVWSEETFAAREGEDSTVAGLLLAAFYQDSPQKLLTMLDRSDPRQLPFLLQRMVRLEQPPMEALRDRAFSKISPKTGNDDFQNRIRAKAILTLSRLTGDDKGLLESLLWDAETHPGLRSWLIHLTADSGIPTQRLGEHLLAASTHPSVIAAILLALGDYAPDAAHSEDLQIENTVVELFTSHPSPQVHASARWLLGHWGRQPTDLAKLLAIEREGERDWDYISNGHAMATIRPPNSSRVFSISMFETTVEQFQRFKRSYLPISELAPDPDSPVHAIQAEDAMAYCNWLSARENIPTEELCYQRYDTEHGQRWKPVADFTHRTGYRLPTTTEFLYAAQGSAKISRPFGENSELLRKYAWYLDNSNGRFHSVGALRPTGFGVFDTLGNLWEWCQDVRGESESFTFYMIGGFNRNPRWGIDIREKTEFLPNHNSISSTFRLARSLSRP